MEVRGEAAIVTGGGSGLGEATARALAAAGARVAVIDRDAERARLVADAIGGVGLACDVAEAEGLAAALAAARQAHGPARIAVSCAGIGPAARIIGRTGSQDGTTDGGGPMPLDAFSEVIRVNLIGTFNLLRLAAAEMAGVEPLAGGERGVIINTASIAAYDGQIGQAAYAASKAGVAGLTLPAARELARSGIRVVAIAPGLFDTPLLAGLPEPVRDRLGEAVPFPPRLGRPAEFARLVLHICENVMLNGEVIRLDGALRMPPK